MWEKELQAAIEAGLKARVKIMEIYNKGFDVEIKEDDSPVTIADKTADKIIREHLHNAFPAHAFLTEESEDNEERLNNDYVWIVDPIDGTKDFVAKNGEFSVNIGLSYKHKAVLGVILIPVTGEIYYGVEGMGSFYLKNKDAKPVKIHVNDKTKDLTTLTSNFHHNQNEIDVLNKHSDVITKQVHVGATIKGCWIACGKAEHHYRYSSNTKEWDTCAMQVIVEQAGGYLLKFDGTPIRYNREDVYNRDGYIICNRLENFLL